MSIAFTAATKIRPMNCDFRAYEVCTNFRRGLLQRDDEPELLRQHTVLDSCRH